MLSSDSRKNYVKIIKKNKKIIFFSRLSIILLFLLLWEVLSRYHILNTFLSSSPSLVYKTIMGLLKDGSLFKHIGITLYEVVVSFGIATLIGLTIATILFI